MSDNKDNNFAALLAGVIIGAAGTYLFTSPDGKKLKEKLLKEGALLLDKVTEGVDQTKEKISEVQEAVQEEAKSTAEAAQKVIETTGEEIAEAAQEIPGKIEEIQKKGRRFFFHKRPPTTNES